MRLSQERLRLFLVLTRRVRALSRVPNSVVRGRLTTPFDPKSCYSVEGVPVCRSFTVSGLQLDQTSGFQYENVNPVRRIELVKKYTFRTVGLSDRHR